MVKYFKTFCRHFWILMLMHFPTSNLDSTDHSDYKESKFLIESIIHKLKYFSIVFTK